MTMITSGSPFTDGTFENTHHRYAGVLFTFSANWRLIVNLKRSRFVVQELVRCPDRGLVWVSGSYYATLSKLITTELSHCEELPDALLALPEFPKDALPALGQYYEKALLIGRQQDWRRDGYARALVTEGSLRLAVCPDGSIYRLQWKSILDLYAPQETFWITQFKSATASAVRQYIVALVYDLDDGPFGKVASKDHIAPNIQAFLRDCPELASDGDWPEFPAIPPMDQAVA